MSTIGLVTLPAGFDIDGHHTTEHGADLVLHRHSTAPAETFIIRTKQTTTVLSPHALVAWAQRGARVTIDADGLCDITTQSLLAACKTLIDSGAVVKGSVTLQIVRGASEVQV